MRRFCWMWVRERKRFPLQAVWNTLLATALLGTEQRKCTVAAPEVDFLDGLATVARDQDHEAWVLLASAYAATARRAGQVPPAAHRTDLPAPAPAETKPYCSPSTGARLATLVNRIGYLDPILQEMLVVLERKGKLVPPDVLPELLTWGRRNKAWRGLLLRVAGERGQWLAQQNPDEWKYSLEINEKDTAELAEAVRMMSGQQALYDALNITDNIFSKTFSVLAGQGPSSHGRMLQLVMEKLLDLGKSGGTNFTALESAKIAVAVPPAVLPELIDRIHKAFAEGKHAWWLTGLVEQLEFRQQMLEELNYE